VEDSVMFALRLLTNLTLCVTTFGVLACERPESFAISGDELGQEPSRLTMQVDMLQYVDDMAAYVSCIQEEYEAARESRISSAELADLAELNNSAVAELEAMRDLYVARIGPIEELVALRPENCIETRPRISSQVVDARNVIFYAREGGIYRNVLKRECPTLTLRPEDLGFGGLGGRRASVRLCNGHEIWTIGDEAVGLGRDRRIMSDCRLGQFFPISDSEASELLGRDR
jgi:hypothetical protein